MVTCLQHGPMPMVWLISGGGLMGDKNSITKFAVFNCVWTIKYNIMPCLDDPQLKHRLRCSIPAAPACKGGPANLLVTCWTAKQLVQDTKKILAEKIVVIGHEFH